MLILNITKIIFHRTKATAIMSNIKAAEYEDMFGLKGVIPPRMDRDQVRVRR